MSGGVTVQSAMQSATSAERRILRLLLRGGKWSVVELVKAADVADPRSQIRRMRGRGVNVLDEWRTCGGEGARHKVFFINPEKLVRL